MKSKSMFRGAAVAAAVIGTSLIFEGVTGGAVAEPSRIRNVVLVHGAFADGSGWEFVAQHRDWYADVFFQATASRKAGS